MSAFSQGALVDRSETYASGGTITLVATSPSLLVIEGVSATTFILPAATDLRTSRYFIFANQSSVTATVKLNDGTRICSVVPNSTRKLALVSKSTANGTWQSEASLPVDSPLMVRETTPTPDVNLVITAGSISSVDGSGTTLSPGSTYAATAINMQTGVVSGGSVTTNGGAFTLPAYALGLFTRMALVYNQQSNSVDTAFSASAVDPSLLPGPSTLFDTLLGVPLAYVDLEKAAVGYKTAGSTTNIIENNVSGTPVIYRYASSIQYSSSPFTIDTSNTSAALRVTQRGSGNAFVVEDSTNPDSTPFTIDSAGKLTSTNTATFVSAPVQFYPIGTSERWQILHNPISYVRNNQNVFGPYILTLPHAITSSSQASFIKMIIKWSTYNSFDHGELVVSGYATQNATLWQYTNVCSEGASDSIASVSFGENSAGKPAIILNPPTGIDLAYPAFVVSEVAINWAGATGLDYSTGWTFTGPIAVTTLVLGTAYEVVYLGTTTTWPPGTVVGTKFTYGSGAYTGPFTGDGAVVLDTGITVTTTLNVSKTIYARNNGDALKISQRGSGNALVVEDEVGDTTPFVIANDGTVFIGGSSTLTPNSEKLQIAGFYSGINAGQGTQSNFYRCNTSISSPSVVANNNIIMSLRSFGYDGVSSYREAAWIRTLIDGATISATSMPGKISFATTADGSVTPVERMRIDQAGNVGIGDLSPDSKLVVEDNSANAAVRITQTGAGNALIVEDSTNPDSTPFVIDSTGEVGIGTSTPTALLHVSGTSANAIARLASTSSGATTFDGSGTGFEIVAGAMNTTNKFTPAIKFGSTDPDFTTTNPKFGAAIIAEAAQTYSGDTSGGMHLAFYTAPTTPGTGNGLIERLRIESTGIINTTTTSALRLPVGNSTTERPTGSASALKGMVRYNDTDDVFEGYNEVSGWSSIGGGGTIDRVTQAGHSFVLGDILYLNSSTYTKARADAANTAEVVGMVSRVIDANTFELTLSGEVTGLSGLTTGEVYFLSASTAGAVTITEPSIVGQISLPVGVASSTTSMYVQPKRGAVVGAANVKTTIPIANAATTTIQDASGYDAGQLTGWVTISATTPLRFYLAAQFSRNGAATNYNLSYQTSGDTPPTLFLVSITAAGIIQITLPSIVGFGSASVTFALDVAAIGATLPLSISTNNVLGSVTGTPVAAGYIGERVVPASETFSVSVSNSSSGTSLKTLTLSQGVYLVQGFATQPLGSISGLAVSNLYLSTNGTSIAAGDILEGTFAAKITPDATYPNQLTCSRYLVVASSTTVTLVGRQIASSGSSTWTDTNGRSIQAIRIA